MKHLIITITMAILLFTMTQVQAEQWKSLASKPSDSYTVAYVNHNKSEDIFMVRFDRQNECTSTIGIVSRVNKSFDFNNIDAKFNVKIDSNTVWFTPETTVIQVNDTAAFFAMKVGFDTINEMKEGTTLRIKMNESSYYNYSLINSSKAINKAEDLCRSLGKYVNPNAKYFDI